jgi:hypothetical protein
MRTRTAAALLVCAILVSGALQAAAPPVPSAITPGPVPAPVVAPGVGLAVLAVGDASSVAWPLARAVYANGALRPPELDEAHARVLAGETPAAGAPKELTELAETRAAIRGDDAPSRRLLASLAGTFRVRGIVVVALPASAAANARVFLADAAAFDAARYAPDPPRSDALGADAAVPEPEWTGAVASLSRAYGAVSHAGFPTSTPASPLAQTPAPVARDGGGGSRPFYSSPWFWGAIGAAAFGGVALFFATRDSGSETIHLQVQVPK